MRWSKRILGAVGDSKETDTDTQLWAFAVIMLIHVSARQLQRVDDPSELGPALVLVACLAAVAARRLVRPALTIAAGITFHTLWLAFPFASNHLMLETLVLVALASFDLRRSEEREVLLQGLRWGTVIVLFHTGVQKLLHATYFDGQFLGYEIAATERFAAMFQLVIPEAEFDRLRSLDTLQAGTGPYSVQSPLFLLMSNGVYVFELSAPFFLAWKRTRVLAAVAAGLFLVSIEAGAREIMFGLLFANLLMLFLPGPVNRRLIVPLALVYSLVILSLFGMLPDWDLN